MRPSRSERLARSHAGDHGQPAERRRPSGPAERESLSALLESGVRAHTDTLLRIAPLIEPFAGLVPQTRVRIRATGSVNYGRSIPEYPEEWGGGTTCPTSPRPARRVARGRDAAARDHLQSRLHDSRPAGRSSDLAALDKRAAILLDRHVPGYREIIASELPLLRAGGGRARVRRASSPRPPRGAASRAAAALWVDARVREPTSSRPPACSRCSTSATWRRTPTAGTRPRNTSPSPRARRSCSGRRRSSAFVALCAERPGTSLGRTPDDGGRGGGAPAAAGARADDRGEAGVRRPADRGLAARPAERSLADCAATGRRCGSWTGRADAAAIEHLVALERLRGSRGA